MSTFRFRIQHCDCGRMPMSEVHRPIGRVYDLHRIACECGLAAPRWSMSPTSAIKIWNDTRDIIRKKKCTHAWEIRTVAPVVFCTKCGFEVPPVRLCPKCGLIAFIRVRKLINPVYRIACACGLAAQHWADSSVSAVRLWNALWQKSA